jgi:hypothetical protein
MAIMRLVFYAVGAMTVAMLSFSKPVSTTERLFSVGAEAI